LQVCSKSFKRPQDLKKHERIHTQEHHTAHKHSKATVSDDGSQSGKPQGKRSRTSISSGKSGSSWSGVSDGGHGQSCCRDVAKNPRGRLADNDILLFGRAVDVSASPRSSAGASDAPLHTPPPLDPYSSLPYPAQLFAGANPVDIYPSLNHHLPIHQQTGGVPFPFPHGAAGQGQLPHPQQQAGFAGYPNMSDGLYNASAINGGAMNAALGAGGRASWDENGGHALGGPNGQQAYSAGQKRQYDLEGFFDEVKKRKVEPTYDHGMARRLEELQRGMGGGAGGFPNQSPMSLNSLAGGGGVSGNGSNQPPHQQQQQQRGPNGPPFDRSAEVYSQAASNLVGDFRNPEDVANANNFLFSLLLNAQAAGQGGANVNSLQAQQAHALLQSLNQGGPNAGMGHGRSPVGLGGLLNGAGHPLPPAFMSANGRPTAPYGGNGQQQQPQQPLPQQAMDQNLGLLTELGIAGMPGLDPKSILANIQLQQQIAAHQMQLQQLLQQQQQQHQMHQPAHQQQQQQQHAGASGTGGLYPSLPGQPDNGHRSRSMSAASRPIAQLPTGSRLSSSFSGSTGAAGGGQMFAGGSNGGSYHGPAGISPAGSISMAAQPSLGHQTLLQSSDSGSSPSPSTASYHSSGYTSSIDDTPPSGAMDPFTTYTAFSPPTSNHGLSPMSLSNPSAAAANAGGGDSPSLTSYALEGINNLSFDSLAKPRAAPVGSGLYPTDTLFGPSKTFKFMEPLSAGRPLTEEPDEERGDKDDDGDDEGDATEGEDDHRPRVMLPRIIVGASSRASSVTAGSDDQAEEVEMATSPSDVALKGRPFLAASGFSAVASGSTDHPRSPILPAGLDDVPPEYRLPSILPRSEAAAATAAASEKTLSAGRRSRTLPSEHDDAHYSSIRSTSYGSSDEESTPDTPPAKAAGNLPATSATTLPSLSSLYPAIALPPIRAVLAGNGADSKPSARRQQSLTEELVHGVDTITLDASSSASATPAATSEDVQNHVELIKGLLLAINRQYQAALAEDAAGQTAVKGSIAAKETEEAPMVAAA